MTGYAHPKYAASLSEYGTPRFLRHSGSWILERKIAGTPYSDAMGCYPIFVCRDWSSLEQDLASLDKNLVCLSLVADPFGDYDMAHLRMCFPDVAFPFKEHFVIDLSRPLDTFVHSHHRRNTLRALREMQVERCINPASFLEDWMGLYSNLIEKHNLTGMVAFSRQSFAGQLAVPGIVAFRAVHNETTIGMLLWYKQARRVYYHLAAYSPVGYELRASFALFDYSIRYFADQQCEWLSLGAGAGAGTNEQSGLSRFKQGWSTGTRTAYFCGRIFDKQRYDEIIKLRNVESTRYFPAYRAGEFF